MRFLVLILMLSANCGCNIPVYSVTPTSYTNSWVERELDDLLPNEPYHEEARSILKKNGYDDVLLTSHADGDFWRTELVATKRRDESDTIRVTMPVLQGRVTKPFRIEWVDSKSGSVTMSETTAPE